MLCRPSRRPAVVGNPRCRSERNARARRDVRVRPRPRTRTPPVTIAASPASIPRRITACASRSPTRTSTSSWPTASRTATRPTTTAACRRARAQGQSGFDPTGKGWYHGGDLKGLHGEARLHQGPRHDRDLADAELQEQGGADRDGQLGRLPRLLDHRLHADRPAPGHQRRPARARRRRARARHQGLLRHHHQPHRGRHPATRTAASDGRPYVSKDQSPYRTAAGTPFDDRDFAGTNSFPPLAPTGQPSCSAPPTPFTSFPYHPCVPDAERERQGARVAERREPLPQPRRHDVHRRELAVRRLLRARRPLHREPARRQRDDRHLQDVDPRLPHRRLPDGHDEARRRRVLAEVRAGDRELRAVAGDPRLLHVRRGGRGLQPADHLALHGPRRRAGRPRLPVPDGRDATSPANSRADRRAARLLRRRRLVHRRRLERLQPADVPRQPRPRAHRHVRAQREPGRERGRAAAARRARARAHVLLARQPGRLLRRRAGLHRRRRRPGRAAGHVPVAGPAVQQPQRPDPRRRRSGQERRHRLRRDADGRQLRPVAPALPRARASSRAVTREQPGAAQRRAAAPLLVRRPRASTRSRASTATRRTSTSSRSTTPSSPRRRRSRRSCPTASGRRSTATGRDAAAQRRRQRSSTSRVGPLSTVVYRAKKHIPRSQPAPPITLDVPADGRDRLEVRAERRRRLVLRGDVPRQGRRRRAGRTSAPTTTRPTACSTTSPTSRPGTTIQYRAVVLDNAGHTRSSAVRARSSRRPRSRSRRRTRASACAAPSRCARRRRRSTRTTSCTFERSVERRPVHADRHRRLLARLHGRSTTRRASPTART